jgi:iron complex transport system substrate-binding protein
MRIPSFRFMLLLVVCLSLLLAACGQSTTTSTGSTSQPTPTTVLDMYGTPISIPKTAPQRIVSLQPSESEILGALHLQSRVVGVDYNTNYPADMAALPKVSNANGDYNVEQIVALRPDFVLSYGGSTKQVDTKLTSLGIDVVDLPLANFTQVLQQMQLVGRLTYTVDAANTLVKQLQQQINQIKAAVAGKAVPKVLLEVDDSSPGKPYVFGGTSFGDELAQIAQAQNIFHDNTTNGGYPQVTDEAIISANPEYVILTEDPAYGGNPTTVYKRANWATIDALKMHHVYRINADITQRPGPRLVEGLQCLAQLVHPDAFTGTLPDYCTANI